MSAFSAGPAWPAEGITEEVSDRGKECERKHRDLLAEVAQRLGTILAGGDAYELLWFLQALQAVSQLAAVKADEIVEGNRKNN